jgi:signal transduction histidine kinase
MQEAATDPTDSPEPSATPTELGLTMTTILRRPLAALRVAMERLSREIGPEDGRQKLVTGALDEVLQLSHDLQALVDYANLRPVWPLMCSLDELLIGVLRGLAPQVRGRLRIDRSCESSPSESTGMWIDGPLFASSLRHVVECCLEAGDGPVRLDVREEPDRLVLLVTREGELADEPSPALPRSEPDERATRSTLLLQLARRDFQRMGGSLQIEPQIEPTESGVGPSSPSQMLVILPNRRARESPR